MNSPLWKRPNAWPCWARSNSHINTGEWLQKARAQLKHFSDQPALESEILLAHQLGKSRAWVLAHNDHNLSSEQTSHLNEQLIQLCAGKPLPYIMGHWEFFGLDFMVSPAVLIPRPETELLVETALEWLQQNPTARRAVDVGTGSGCIGISLCRHVLDLNMTGIDLYKDALAIAEKNVFLHQLQGRIALMHSDLLSGTDATFNLICANLPYIPTNTLQSLRVSKHEPSTALDGGEDGLNFIDRLLHQAIAHMAPGGLILLEIEAGQGDSSRLLARACFPNAAIEVKNDLAGLPRLLCVQLQNIIKE
jgi:release factor glutamine methyltransferase